MGQQNVLEPGASKGLYAFLSFSCYPSYHQDHFWANPMHDEGLWGDDLKALIAESSLDQSGTSQPEIC